MVFHLKFYTIFLAFCVSNFNIATQNKIQNVFNKKGQVNTNLTTSTINVLHSEKYLDTTFEFKYFKYPLKIQVYVPKNYANFKKNYPVIYFMGDNTIFKDSLSKNNWEVNFILDSLEKEHRKTALIIEVNAGVINESDTTVNGIAFINFLADSIKPFIDKHYRTLKDPNNTIIVGGGLQANLSYLAFVVKNNVFGKAGLFSPSFDFAPHLKILIDRFLNIISGKLFYYYGKIEDSLSQQKGETNILALGEKSNAVIYNLVDTEGANNIIFWKKYFPSFINWALAEGNNSIIDLNN